MGAHKRPRKYRQKIEFSEDDLKKLKTLSGLGMNIEQCAIALDVSKMTLDRRIQDDEKVREAILKGRMEASAAVRQCAFKMAVSGKHPVMTIFWLKTRERWKEDADDETYQDPEHLRM